MINISEFLGKKHPTTSIKDDEFLKWAMERIRTTIEESFSLPKDFMDQICTTDDWAFVIKVHALLEGAVNYYFKIKFPFLEKENYYRNISPKVNLIDNNSLIESKYISFIEKFSKLRNDLVHKVKNVTFSFEQLSQEQKVLNEYVTVFILEEDITYKTREKRFIDNPKLEIWLSAFTIIILLYNKSESLRTEESLKQIARENNWSFNEYEQVSKKINTGGLKFKAD